MKKHKKILISVTSILLACIMLAMTVVNGEVKEVSAASTRMYGVQQIIQNLAGEDPFTILEVVPDKAMASLGYYVQGSEPVLDEKLFANSVFTVDGTATGYTPDTTTASRKALVETYFAGILGETNIVSIKFGSIYEERLIAPSDLEGWKVLEAPEGMKFAETRTGYYAVAADVGLESGDYTLNTKEVTGGTVEYYYTFTPDKGEYVWIDETGTAVEGSEATSWTGVVEFDTLYYRTNIKSNNWFATKVLETTSSYNIEVVTVTPTELEEMLNSTEEEALELNDVDLMYISNSTCLNISNNMLTTFDTYAANTVYTVNTTNDISWETAYSIYEYVVNTNMPVIVDDPLVSGDVATLLTANNNLYRLTYLLKDYTSTTTMATHNLPATLSTDATEKATEDAALGAKLAEKLASVDSKAGTDGFVSGNVFIKKLVPNLVNTSFATTLYTVGFDETADETQLAGLAAIVDEIESENFYNNAHNEEYTSEYDATNKEVNISEASLVKYILNYRYRRVAVYKDKITVLDIEPTKYSTLTEEMVKEWLGSTEASERIQEINIVQTTTSEFIGKIVDLNEEYDLIYIGSCIGGAYMHGSMNQDYYGSTVYNDETMAGLIYTHTGDSVEANKKFGGLLSTEYANKDGVTALSSETVKTRHTGNDITEEKMDDLMEFVESGYPVIIAEDLYSGSTINPRKVDANSYLYQFMSNYTGDNAVNNVLKQPKGSEDSMNLVKYINMPKLNLAMISAPTEYAVTYADEKETSIADVDYLEKVGNDYVLLYTFEFSDTSESANDTTAYKVQLYIDTNADGKFADSEEIDGLSVMETYSDTEVAANNLQTNMRYTVSRKVPEGYVGMLPWQLKVSMVESDDSESSVRATANGYTAIQASATPVKVLQIASTYFSQNLVLQDSSRYENGRFAYAGNKLFDSLFEDMKQYMGYDVTIDVISVDGYVSQYKNYKPKQAATKTSEFYNDFFDEYDMIILGFEDCYSDISDAGAATAIQMFIESGRSVLFSHDTTSYVNAEVDVFGRTINVKDYSEYCYFYWGYHLNQYIRSQVGMDRYGITEDKLSLLKKGNALTSLPTLGVDGSTISTTATTSQVKTFTDVAASLNKDIAYKPNSTGTDIQQTTVAGTHGFNSTNLDISNNSSSKYYSLYYEDRNHVQSSISQVNQGQITTYPYNLNIESIHEDDRTEVKGYEMLDLGTAKVNSTHVQYYQLDMNIDKDNDDNSDMVVWYCLADGAYDASPNNVRNNYYIYSVGNVTYTGMGHFATGYDSAYMDLYEAKLFVNTIIASLDSGKRNPNVSIVANDTNKGSSLDYIFRTYDEELEMYDVSDATVYFYATDSNIINGTKELEVTYYVETTDAANADASYIDDSGKTIYLKIDSGLTGTATVQNNTIASITVDGDWIKKKMDASNGEPVKIHIGVRTKLSYNYINDQVEYTERGFDSVTFVQRDLFELD